MTDSIGTNDSEIHHARQIFPMMQAWWTSHAKRDVSAFHLARGDWGIETMGQHGDAKSTFLGMGNPSAQ